MQRATHLRTNGLVYHLVLLHARLAAKSSRHDASTPVIAGEIGYLDPSIGQGSPDQMLIVTAVIAKIYHLGL